MDDRRALPDTLQDMIDWLAAEPDDDASVELAALEARSRQLETAEFGDDDRERVLTGLAERAMDVAESVRPHLLAAHLPVPVSLHRQVELLHRCLLGIAERLAALVDLRLRDEHADAPRVQALMSQVLCLVEEVFVSSDLAAARVPEGCWQLVNRVARAGGLGEAGRAGALRTTYLRILAVAVSQPEGLRARERVWLREFFDERIVGLATLGEPQDDADGASWWLDLRADAAPVALARRALPDELKVPGRVWMFNTRGMAQKLGECIEWITAQMTAAELAGASCDFECVEAEGGGFPPGLEPREILALLRRLRMHWIAAPVREQPRRPNHYPVQVSVGLHAVWRLGSGEPERARLQAWTVLNESPGGYAIMSVTGVEGEVEAGTALALRRDEGQPWSVCIVRWVRSEAPGRIELGLQLIGVSFQSVQVGFRGKVTQKLAPALALPVMEPLRRHPAMLAPAGTYASRRFVFVREGRSIYIAQARALGLDMQTQGVELFQYEIDPYPI